MVEHLLSKFLEISLLMHSLISIPSNSIPSLQKKMESPFGSGVTDMIDASHFYPHYPLIRPMLHKSDQLRFGRDALKTTSFASGIILLQINYKVKYTLERNRRRDT